MAEEQFDHRHALKRGMEAIEHRERIAIVRGKAKPHTAKDAPDELKAEAVADAKAWNMLKHLASVL
jgi:hypothetical protein